MSLRLEKFLVLLVSLLICGFILAWSFFLNFGKIKVSSNQPFEIQNLDKQILFCETGECLFKVPIGIFTVTFHAEEFKEITAQVEIRRFQTTEAILNFEYQPVLIESEIVADIQNTENFKIKFSADAKAQWDRSAQNVVYFKTEGNKTELRLYQKSTDEFVKITNFYNFEDTQIYWGEAGETVIVRNNQDFYVVDLTQKLKSKANFHSDGQTLLFAPDDAKVIYENMAQLYVYNLDSRESTALNLEMEIENLVWKNAENLLYFLNTENETQFYQYNFAEEKSELVFTTNLLNPQNLSMSSDGQDLEFESQGKAYELRLIQ